MQRSLSQSLPIHFYGFDLLNRNGELLVNLPLSRRRELLESLLTAPKDPLRLSPLLRASAGEVLEAVRIGRFSVCSTSSASESGSLNPAAESSRQISA